MTLKVDASPASETLDPALTEGAEAPDGGTQVIDANTADSSAVDQTDAKAPASLLDVVKNAVEKPAGTEASSTPEADPAKPEGAAPADDAEAKPDDEANLPFHNHPRWKELVSERDGLKAERETLSGDAERFRSLDTWRQEHNLTGEEVAEGYEIMALLKSGDHGSLSKAREWFAERMSDLDSALGNTLPADLQERIDSGLLDEEGAQEIARARAAANLRTTQDASRATAEAEDRTQRDVAAKTTAMVEAVEGWEARIKASDPDYAKKANLILDRCQRITAAEGSPPRTPEEATALADRAHREITAELKATMPKPRMIAPSPVGRSTSAAPAPATLRDAINAAVGR